VSTDPTLLDRYASLVGGMPAIVNIGGDWANAPIFNPSVMDFIRGRGSIPMWTWVPADLTITGPQPAFADRTITAGRYDGYIHNFARAAKAWGHPFFIRFGHEMNGNWYPWSTGDGNLNGNAPADFRAMWRYVHGVFSSVGAHNAVWVWCVNTSYPGSTPLLDVYPGNDVVDWIGIDGYNRGGAQWRSLQQVFSATYQTIATHTTKPIMFAEISSAEQGGSKAQWITTGFLSTIPRLFPRVRAVVWFDWYTDEDWRVNSSTAALAAFRKVVGSPLYKGRLALP
jgi:beta-mannanase